MKIKVCGMRDAQNITDLVKLGIDYMGFIFFEKSKRNVTVFPQVDIPNSIKKVGVFVNKAIDEVVAVVQQNGFKAVQLHGGESVEYIQELKSKLNDIEIIKVFSVGEEFDFDSTKDFEAISDLFLFDTKGKYLGGNGVKFNWDILSGYQGNVPFLLSGGIALEDAADVKAFMQSQAGQKCVGVDLNSGFEIEPALKNIEELKEFKKQVCA